MATVQTQSAGARERVPLGGILIDRWRTEDVLERCRMAIAMRRRMHIVTANLQFLSMARGNSSFREVVNAAEAVVADGVPVVWLSKLYGQPVPARITGHDLTSLLAAMAAKEDRSLFLLGGAPDAALVAAAKLRTANPGLRIAGTAECRVNPDGSFASEDEANRILARLQTTRPDILLVALGCPKQEYWIARYAEQTGVPVHVGVGSVFDVLAGRAKRAPRWMQRSGLEWAYRMAQEPARLGKRYLLGDLPTAGRLVAGGISQRLGLARRSHA